MGECILLLGGGGEAIFSPLMLGYLKGDSPLLLSSLEEGGNHFYYYVLEEWLMGGGGGEGSALIIFSGEKDTTSYFTFRGEGTPGGGRKK